MSMMTPVLLTLILSSAPTEDGELMVTIQRIDNASITVTKAQMGGGRTGGGRRGRGRRGETITLSVAGNVRVTTATWRRKTRDFRIGAPLGGGLKNKVLRDLSSRALARVVLEAGRVVEINVVVDSSDATTVIAVRPKRPPTKK